MPERQLRILHVVNSLEAGGMENGVVNMARALDPGAFEVHVACLERRGAFAERLPHPENVSVLGKSGGFSWQAVQALSREIARVRPHVLHSHNLGPLIYASLASWFGLACPILQGEHAELTAAEQVPRRLLQRHLFYRCCRKIHTVSHGMTRQLISFGFPRAKIETIVNGVDTDRFLPGDRTMARQKIGLPAEALVVGIVGRFGPFKGHSVLVDAFENSAHKFLDLHLLIVGGGGPEETRIRERVSQSPVSSRIHLVGLQADMRPYYQAMDLLVLPSVNEGLSNALLEAMACGIPALANAACGNNDVIENRVDGFVADINTPVLLGLQLEQVLQARQQLTSIGLAARRKVLQSLTIERMVAAYARIYRETCRWRE